MPKHNAEDALLSLRVNLHVNDLPIQGSLDLSTLMRKPLPVGITINWAISMIHCQISVLPVKYLNFRFFVETQ